MSSEYDPFNYRIDVVSSETQSVIEQTRNLALSGKIILREIVHIGTESYILRPIKR